MTHGHYPLEKDTYPPWTGFPIKFQEEHWPHIMWQEVARGLEPVIYDNGELHHHSTLVTAGNYVAIACGSGDTVQEAQMKAYEVAWATKWPSNRMFRTDIGKKLAGELEVLQSLGYAKGMKYAP